MSLPNCFGQISIICDEDGFHCEPARWWCDECPAVDSCCLVKAKGVRWLDYQKKVAECSCGLVVLSLDPHPIEDASGNTRIIYSAHCTLCNRTIYGDDD